MTDFANWLRQKQRSESTILKYVGALDGVLSEWAIAAGLSKQGLQTVTDPVIFESIALSLSRLPVFQERNVTGHHMYSAAIARYGEYIAEVGGKAATQFTEISQDELKGHWIDQITALAFRYRISDLRVELKSPTFVFGNWRVGVEHQRNYRSVVIHWIGPVNFKPQVHHTWAECPKSDLAKGWDYRKPLTFPEIEGLLVELSQTDVTEEEYRNEFERAYRRSRGSSIDELERRLEAAEKIPRSYEVRSRVYDRNLDVVAAVLIRANGVCEECQSPAPFNRKSDNSPYLEVHHKKPLAHGGEDSVQNAIGLCPNCHRKAHFG